MLDVHPPHTPTHTWKDFFIHIATIVIGLIIAVGLEQSVEWLHHHHQMHTLRERLHDEAEVNQRILLQDQRNLVLIEAHMDRALAEARSLQNKQSLAIEPVNTTFALQGFYSAAFNNAKSSGTLDLLPYDESAMYADAYESNAICMQSGLDLWKALHSVHAALHGRSLAELDPAELTGLIAAVSDARDQAEMAGENFDLQQQEWQAVLSGHYRTDIAPTK